MTGAVPAVPFNARPPARHTVAWRRVPSCRPGAALLLLVVAASGCGGAAKSVPPPPAIAPLRDCSAFAPCDAVRQQWFSNEAKDAEVWDTYCNPPAPTNAADCRGLERAMDKLHGLNIQFFSDLCRRLSGKSAADVYPFVGRPDRDETSSCGSGQCRLWLWYWFGGGQSGIFTMLLKLPAGTQTWALQRCNYCTPFGCQDMPITP